MGGFRLVVDLLSNQTEPITNLFEQYCAIKTTVASSNKNDPRLVNATALQTAQPTASSPSVESTNATTTISTTSSTMNAATASSNNKEERESISNAVASLPPAQVSRQTKSNHLLIIFMLSRCLN